VGSATVETSLPMTSLSFIHTGRWRLGDCGLDKHNLGSRRDIRNKGYIPVLSCLLGSSGLIACGLAPHQSASLYTIVPSTTFLLYL
jgi:hypothetical protein